MEFYCAHKKAVYGRQLTFCLDCSIITFSKIFHQVIQRNRLYMYCVVCFQAFSKDKKKTIITKNPAYQDIIGDTDKLKHLSFNDVKAANIMYKCAGNVYITRLVVARLMHGHIK